MVLPRYHKRDGAARAVSLPELQPSQENIHAVGESLSRSCNIRLPRYLPHFRAFHFAPVPLAAVPLLSAVTHFAKAAATNRDKSGVKQTRTACAACLFISPATESDSPLLRPPIQ